jgi:tol-pal system protein YbgF
VPPAGAKQGALVAPAQTQGAGSTQQAATTAPAAGTETISDAPANAAQATIAGAAAADTAVNSSDNADVTAPADTAAAAPVSVAANTAADPAAVAQPSTDATAQAPAAGGDGIQQVSLTPAAVTPESLYEKGVESLLRRKFGDAESGFRGFLEKYPDHSLAGSAQYQLGETFYAQGDYRTAAQNYLQAYKNYPKSRRAPDSLLKLGMALGKMGQKDQACSALGSVATEFPQAVDAKKRAQVELKRAGC